MGYIEGASVEEATVEEAASLWSSCSDSGWIGTLSPACVGVRNVVIPALTCARGTERVGEGGSLESLVRVDAREEVREEILCKDIAGSECA